jgi:CSLREA domain-containing protein
LIKSGPSSFFGVGRLAAAALLLIVLLGVPTPVQAATYTVNTTDDADDGTCDARHCSLREALDAANSSPGSDTIRFNIPGAGPHVIRPDGTLYVSDDGTTIDGTTQPGYSPDPGRFGTPAVSVQAPTSLGEGRGGGPGFGLQIISSGNTVRGLRLSGCGGRGWGQAIYVSGSGNLVERNIIGLELDGEVCTAEAVQLIGDSNIVRDNVIVAYGEAIRASATSYPPGSGNHVIQGNYIGLDPEGAVASEDLQFGIYVTSSRVLIGGDGPGEGNVISGADVGIRVGNEGTEVVGNLIGTDPSGTAAIPNRQTGIQIWGEGCVVRSNLISGNPVGIQVGHTYPSAESHGRDVVVLGNFIGTDQSGMAAIPNGKGIVLGPEVETAQIGGADPSQANVISGNGIGIEAQGGSPTILGNRIGTNSAGTAAIPNEYGILIWDRATEVRVGGSAAGERNLISGNTRTGLWLRADGGIVQGNWIGLAADGGSALPNGTGLDIGGDSNRIGGAGAGERNVISGNENGAVVDGGSNVLLGNLIGTDPSGSSTIPNAVGIYLSGDGNTLGEAAAPNLISGNGRGLVVTGSHNTVQDNRIGTDLAAVAELPNGIGIEVFGPYNQIGSGTLPGNQVLYNNGPGIRLSSLAVGNTIAGNTIAYNAQEGIRIEPGGGVALNTISRNSMYDNSWLGIDLLPGAQADIAAPVIDSITIPGESTTGAVRGHACPDCRVELFLADPDPSGSGEGRTYTAGRTVESGAFTVIIPIGATIGICQPFTATATDTEGNTSEFSLNMTPFGCLHIPWIVIVLGVPALLVIGALVGGLGGRPHGRPGLGAAAGGAAGGLVGVVIVVVLAFLPSVQIVAPHIPHGGGSPVAPAPPCAQFINSTQLRPEDGAAFELGTDVLFELSPQPDPPGVQTRWTLQLSGPAGLEVTRLLSAPSASLSSVGVDDPAAGAYQWRLSAERLNDEGGDWNPFCADLTDRTFFLLQPTAPASPVALVNQEAACRLGPSQDYPVLGYLTVGTQLDVQGRNEGSSWWYLLNPNLQLPCWVWGQVLELSGDLEAVPVQQAGPPPVTPVTPVQTVDCSVYSTNPNACNANQACWWNPSYPLNTNGSCVNK